MSDMAPTATSTALSLADIATPDGAFAIVAMDQRNTLKRMYAAAGIADPSDTELVGAKADVVSALRPAASALLLDPTYGIPALTEVDASGGMPGILVAAEPSSRGNWEGEPRASRDPDQGAAWVRAQGGQALKFLVQVRAGRPVGNGPDLVAEARQVVGDVVADCREQGVPSVIENLIYPLPGEQLTARQREDVVIESARMLDDLGPDLLKLEYPGSPQACRRLARTIRAPWAVLSAGVAFEEFSRVLEISCDEGGASGFIAGRAVWKDIVGMSRPDRQAFLAGEALRRLEGCVAAISGRARPWTEATGS